MTKFALEPACLCDEFNLTPGDRLEVGTFVLMMCLKIHNEYRTNHDLARAESHIRVMLDHVMKGVCDDVEKDLHKGDTKLFLECLDVVEVELHIFGSEVGTPELSQIVSQFVSRARPHCNETGLSLSDLRIAAMTAKVFDLRDRARRKVTDLLQKLHKISIS